MTISKGRVIARLAEPDERIPADLVQQINRIIRPPDPLTADDVYIRSMYIVSDRVNSFGGRFPEDEHKRLAELMIDSPVMIGHRKDKLPVGRNFHAVTVLRNGQPWVKSYFYWLRSSKEAKHLAENIDGGIYKECSVAFTFGFPECSICGKDIRLCPHQPLESYSRHGRREACHFNYRRIEKVLETSLVYRGAVPETSISKELKVGAIAEGPPECVSVTDLTTLDPQTKYLIIPRYDALEVVASVSDHRLVFSDSTGITIGDEAGYDFQPAEFRPDRPVRGLLVGYHGKDRCEQSLTKAFLDGRPMPVSRLVLNVLPNQGVEALPSSPGRSALDVRIIPHREALPTDINRKALEIMTRDGVELLAESDEPLTALRLLYEPTYRYGNRENYYLLERTEKHRGIVLRLVNHRGGIDETFIVPCFDTDRLEAGRRFVAWPMEHPKNRHGAPRDHDTLVSLSRDHGALRFESSGQLAGCFSMRPMILNGRRGYLLSHHNGGA